MIDGKNFSDQPIKNNKVTYKNIRKIAIGQGDKIHSWLFVRLSLLQRKL